MALRSKWAAGPAAAGRDEGAYLDRYVTEEDYWASDPDFHEITETAAAQGEMLLTKPKRDRPTFRDYQIKPLYESNPRQPANTFYMITLWDKNIGRLFDSYEAAFNWLRKQLEANNHDSEQI